MAKQATGGQRPYALRFLSIIAMLSFFLFPILFLTGCESDADRRQKDANADLAHAAALVISNTQQASTVTLPIPINGPQATPSQTDQLVAGLRTELNNSSPAAVSTLTSAAGGPEPIYVGETTNPAGGTWSGFYVGTEFVTCHEKEKPQPTGPTKKVGACYIVGDGQGQILCPPPPDCKCVLPPVQQPTPTVHVDPRRPTDTPLPPVTRTSTPTNEPPKTCKGRKVFEGVGEKCHILLDIHLPVVVDVENESLPLPHGRPPYNENSSYNMDGFTGHGYGWTGVWQFEGDGCTEEYVHGQRDQHVKDRNADPSFPEVIGPVGWDEMWRLGLLVKDCPSATALPPTPTPEPTEKPACNSTSPMEGEVKNPGSGFAFDQEIGHVEFWFDPPRSNEDGTEWNRVVEGPVTVGQYNSSGRVKIWRYPKATCSRDDVITKHTTPHMQARKDAGKNSVWADDPTWTRLLAR